MNTTLTHTMRCIIASAIIVTLSLGSLAQNTVSVSDALNIANGFKPKSRSMSRSVSADVNPELAYTCANDTSNKPYYYVFNYADNKGFVIISSDTRAKQVIGYSYSGKFDMNNIPEQLKDLLKIYEDELSDLSITPDSLLKMDLSQYKSRSLTLPVSVAPILGNIKYNQHSPYNDQCPMHNGKRSVTGCVATATAQVMSFHKYPAKGKGSNEYTSNSGIHSSVNFSNATYNWDNIVATYGTNSTPAQNAEIAKLLFHIGVSCNMNYTSSGSSASLIAVSQALVDNFSYDKNIQRYSREYYSPNEWKTLLMTELAAGRPVLFEGYNEQSGGGHCFVCDGYDANGLYHINWGWGGMADGYFSLDNLNPAIMGVGGGSGAYNSNVAFIGGIQPATSTSLVFNNISVDAVSAPKQVQRDEKFKLALTKLHNAGIQAFDGTIGVALYKNEQILQILATTSCSLKARSYYPSININNISVPSNVTNGEYYLVLVSKLNGQSNWEVCLSKNSINNCIGLTVSADKLVMKNNTSKTYTNFGSLHIQPSANSNNGDFTTFNDLDNENTNNSNTNTTNNNTNINSTTTTGLQWLTSKNEAFAKAKQENKKVFMLYGRSTCGNCNATKNYCEGNVLKPIIDKSYVLWYVNCDDQTLAREASSFLRNIQGNTLPFLAVIDPQTSNTLENASGAQSVEKLKVLLSKYLSTSSNNTNNGINNTNQNDMTAAEKEKPNHIYGSKINPCVKNPIKFENGNSNNIDASKLKFSLTIHNQSQTVYNNFISAHLYTSQNKYIGEIGTQICNLKSDEVKVLSFSKNFKIDAGKYFIAIFYIDENGKYQLPQPRQYSMQEIQVAGAQDCNSGNCVAPIEEKYEDDFQFISIKVKGKDCNEVDAKIAEYTVKSNSWITVTGNFKNNKRRGNINIGMCVVKYEGEYITDIKETNASTVPGLRHTIVGNYIVDLTPGKYIITGYYSEDGEYKPIGNEKSNYVILNVK